jgi:hypothetical protein
MAAPFAASGGLLDCLELVADPTGRCARWRAGSRLGAALALRAGLAGRLGGGALPGVPLEGERFSELRGAAIAAAICGSAICFRGAPERVPPERWRLLRRLLPPGALRPVRLAGHPGALALGGPEGSLLIAWVDAPDLPLALEGLAGSGPLRVFDAWRGIDLGIPGGAIGGEQLEAGLPQLLRVSPVDGGAHLLGSNLHLASGTELASCDAEAGGGAVLALAMPGRHRGVLAVQVPGCETPVRLRVVFEDGLRVSVDAARVTGTIAPSSAI